MAELLPNYLEGRWQSGAGEGTILFDPVLGTELVRVDATGIDLTAAFAYARNIGGRALRAMTYGARARALSAVVKILQSRREHYYDIALANSGTVRNDSAVDIDGGIFTLGTYARIGETLGEAHVLPDGDSVRLGKDPLFQSQHMRVPAHGVALLINAFNFPSWGMWEKAAPALLSGVPVIVKPATSTAWLTHQMVRDVVDAGILPPGALSVICGSSVGLLDQLTPFDRVSFTGSAQTAATIRSHRAICDYSVRVNIEADSVNSALLLPPTGADSESVIDLLAQEVMREMTVKSGQKCTAIRRILVPSELYAQTAEVIGTRLAGVTVGNPRNDTVRMGALVSRAQFKAVNEGLQRLKAHTQVMFDGAGHPLIDVEPGVSCCMGPTLLGAPDTDTHASVHETEVFGPVATLIPYRDLEHGLDLVRRGQGSLVASLYGSDSAALAEVALELASSHGRIHVVSPDVAATHTGHGTVMPFSIHGGPGRAGGGEELGGLRALDFYHQRCAIQASSDVIQRFA